MANPVSRIKPGQSPAYYNAMLNVVSDSFDRQAGQQNAHYAALIGVVGATGNMVMQGLQNYAAYALEKERMLFERDMTLKELDFKKQGMDLQRLQMDRNYELQGIQMQEAQQKLALTQRESDLQEAKFKFGTSVTLLQKDHFNAMNVLRSDPSNTKALARVRTAQQAVELEILGASAKGVDVDTKFLEGWARSTAEARKLTHKKLADGSEIPIEEAGKKMMVFGADAGQHAAVYKSAAWRQENPTLVPQANAFVELVTTGHLSAGTAARIGKAAAAAALADYNEMEPHQQDAALVDFVKESDKEAYDIALAEAMKLPQADRRAALLSEIRSIKGWAGPTEATQRVAAKEQDWAKLVRDVRYGVYQPVLEGVGALPVARLPEEDAKRVATETMKRASEYPKQITFGGALQAPSDDLWLLAARHKVSVADVAKNPGILADFGMRPAKLQSLTPDMPNEIADPRSPEAFVARTVPAAERAGAIDALERYLAKERAMQPGTAANPQAAAQELGMARAANPVVAAYVAEREKVSQYESASWFRERRLAPFKLDSDDGRATALAGATSVRNALADAAVVEDPAPFQAALASIERNYNRANAEFPGIFVASAARDLTLRENYDLIKTRLDMFSENGVIAPEVAAQYSALIKKLVLIPVDSRARKLEGLVGPIAGATSLASPGTP